MSFDQEGNYIVYINGSGENKETGTYAKSDGDAYLLHSDTGASGVFVITSQVAYLYLPVVSEQPVAMTKIDDIPTKINSN